MTNSEIRKLLGGYATNTLTEAERKALFEAALEDQELFDALHGEQALKDLLADPISRDQIRQALEKAGPAKPEPAWWSRWWAWTGAAGAVAAAVLIVAVTRSHAPETQPPYASVPAPKPESVPPAAKMERDDKVLGVPQPGGGPVAHYRARSAAPGSAGKQAEERASALGARSEGKDEVALDAARPAPPPPAAQAPQQSPAAIAQQIQITAQAPPPAPRSQSRATSNQAQSQEALQTQNSDVNSLREQEQNRIAPTVVSGALFKSLPPVTYFILKRDQSGAYQPPTQETELKPGDAVRLTVAPTMSGYLSLMHRDASGNWERVFPASGPGLPVSANANYTIPDVPIEVQGSDQNFRLALVPVSTNAAAFSPEIRQRSQLGGAKAKTAPAKKAAANTPLVVDLTIGPKRAP